MECRSPLRAGDLLRGDPPAACPLFEPDLRKVFLAIYGNGSANKMPGSGSSVLLDYEFCSRYLDALAELYTPSHEHTLIEGNAQPLLSSGAVNSIV